MMKGVEASISMSNNYQASFNKKDALDIYASNPCFEDVSSYFIPNDPFTRPIRVRDIGYYKLLSKNTPLSKEKFSSGEALLAQRILMNIYEQDLMFLPESNLNWNRYQEFYSDNSRIYGEFIRPDLEKYLFGFLEDEVKISGGWDLETLHQYCSKTITDVATSSSTLAPIVLNANSPSNAAKFFIIQCASDFLSEASAMARNCSGAYGPFMSELFKILIDEYGYGVHKTKHSEAFVNLMESVDLNPSIHYYWQFYTASSISLINYFHLLCKNHGNFFKYLGALYYTEATLAYTTERQTNMLKGVFGGSVDTFYFEEHTHIDQHHGRMAFDNLISPIVKHYGESVIPQILAGFEEFRVIQDLADEDLVRQISYGDNLAHWKDTGTKYWNDNKSNLKPGIVLTEENETLSILHTHDSDELLTVVDGSLEFISNPLSPITLTKGDAIIIPKYIHHGSRVLSDACTYKTFPINYVA